MAQPGTAPSDADDWVAGGVLVVRASGAGAARAALQAMGPVRAEPAELQLIMRATVPRGLCPAEPLVFPGCTVTTRPVAGERPDSRRVIVVLTAATHRLSISFAELQPLMWTTVPVDRALHGLFSSAVGHLLAAIRQDPAGGPLDAHGVGHHLLGLAELVLRSALREQLHRADTAAARRREAVSYVNDHLADPDLTAERVADALFISRRRLYQLFDDGEGISGRIRRLRIERAKELLADPTRSLQGIGELSRQCGFTNSAHFSRTFRKIVGQTPREYRVSSG